MRQHWTDPAAIAAEIARIRSLPLDALRRRWRVMFGRTPPAALSKDLLGRMMACRLQEQAFGSLDRESLRFLDGLARHGGAPRCSFATITASATPSPSRPMALTGRARPIRASRPSPAPSLVPPGVVPGSSPWREATAHRLRTALIRRGRGQAAIAPRPESNKASLPLQTSSQA